MEWINFEIPFQRVIHRLTSQAGLRKLVGPHGAACFVLVRSGLAPDFYGRLIKNSETIDATTRHHIAFIVFHGKDSSLVRRGPGWGSKCHLMGLSISGNEEISLSEHEWKSWDLEPDGDLEFDRQTADNLRHSSVAPPLNQIERAMDVATTELLERFGVPERALPCLLFADGSYDQDFQVVQLSFEKPLESLYKDVLAPLADEFSALERFWQQRNRIKRTLETNAHAVSIMKSFPDKLKALETKLQRTRAEIEESVDTSSTKLIELMKERDELEMACEAHNEGTIDQRLQMIPRDSKYFTEAHDIKARLIELESQKKVLTHIH